MIGFRPGDLGAGSHSILDTASRLGVPELAEEKSLVIRCENGDRDAIDNLSIRNARLIVGHLRYYRSVHADDLFQAGMMGIIRAAEKVKLPIWERTLRRMTEPSSKYFRSDPHPFAYYAQIWIRAMMGREAAYQGASIYRGMNIGMVARAKNPETVAALRNASNTVSIDHINFSRKVDRHYSDIGVGLIPMVDDVLSVDPDYDLQHLDIDKIYEVAELVLDSRSLAVVKSIYGRGCDPTSVADVGRNIGLSRERTRQIRNESLEKIRKELRRRARK